MSNKLDALLPSAKDFMKKLAVAEAEEASKEAKAQARAEAEKKALLDHLTKPSGVSDEEGIKRAVVIIEKTLTGVPKEIYDLWERHFRDRGYKLRCEIIEFPGGMPGDVAMTLSWV
jgi:hypothetical protein